MCLPTKTEFRIMRLMRGQAWCSPASLLPMKGAPPKGSLYTLLGRLADKGFVSRRSGRYRLTAAGERFSSAAERPK